MEDICLLSIDDAGPDYRGIGSEIGIGNPKLLRRLGHMAGAANTYFNDSSNSANDIEVETLKSKVAERSRDRRGDCGYTSVLTHPMICKNVIFEDVLYALQDDPDCSKLTQL